MAFPTEARAPCKPSPDTYRYDALRDDAIFSFPHALISFSFSPSKNQPTCRNGCSKKDGTEAWTVHVGPY